MNLAAKLYLGSMMALDYPEQEPEHKYARWYHLLWMLVPIMGILLFYAAVEHAAAKAAKQGVSDEM